MTATGPQQTILRLAGLGPCARHATLRKNPVQKFRNPESAPMSFAATYWPHAAQVNRVARILAGCACVVAHAHAHAQDSPADPAQSLTTTPPTLETQQVTGSAQAQRQFDSAASHSSVAVDAFTAPTPLVNLSELLAGQAGVVATDRGNYAQDLQIAVRGFGSRATFGVRGVRILVDGIPATMPGGQGLGGLVGVSHFETEGWRGHSAARRTHLNAKLQAQPDSRTRITALVNLYDQPQAQDPLGLTRAQFDGDPRQASALATTFNTRKSVGQNQLALVLERQLSDTDSVRLRAYGGGRQLTQYLSFSGAAANSAGGVVDLDRSYQGAAATWTRAVRLPSGLPLTWTVGAEANRLSEHRQGFVNNAGTSGALRRDEQDGATNTDVYAQVDAWLSPRWRAIAGLRASQVRVKVHDRYITPANPDDRGARSRRPHRPRSGEH